MIVLYLNTINIKAVNCLRGSLHEREGKESFRRVKNGRDARGGREEEKPSLLARPYSLAPQTPFSFLFKHLPRRLLERLCDLKKCNTFLSNYGLCMRLKI